MLLRDALDQLPSTGYARPNQGKRLGEMFGALREELSVSLLHIPSSIAVCCRRRSAMGGGCSGCETSVSAPCRCHHAPCGATRTQCTAHGGPV